MTHIARSEARLARRSSPRGSPAAGGSRIRLSLCEDIHPPADDLAILAPNRRGSYEAEEPAEGGGQGQQGDRESRNQDQTGTHDHDPVAPGGVVATPTLGEEQLGVGAVGLE